MKHNLMVEKYAETFCIEYMKRILVLMATSEQHRKTQQIKVLHLGNCKQSVPVVLAIWKMKKLKNVYFQTHRSFT